MTRLSVLRVKSGSCVPWRVRGVGTANRTGRWQDKRAHIARRSSGWFYWFFRRLSHFAVTVRNVRQLPKVLYLRCFFHIVGYRDGR